MQKEKELEYQSLINGMNDTVFVISFDGKFINVNDTALKFLGYSRKELLKKGPADIDPQLSVGEIKALIEGMKMGETQVFETIHQKKNGEKVQVEISSSLIRYQGEKAILSIARDISERKKSQELLRESEELFRLIIENLPNSVFVHDLHGKITMINKLALEYTGYSKDELLNMSVSDIDPEASERDDRKKIWNKLQYGNSIQIQSTHKRKNGTTYPAEISISATKIKGKPLLIAIVQDITERQRSKLLLQESEKKLIEAQRLAKAGHYTFDIQNDKWSNSAELDNIFEIGKNFQRNLNGWMKIIHPDYREKIKNNMIHEVNNGKTRFNHEYKIITVKNKKEKWVQGQAYLNFDKEGNLINMFGTIQDITERKKTEEKLKKQNEEYQALNRVFSMQNKELSNSLEQIQKINKELEKAKEKAEESDRLKTAFLANMSHEIRTPMNGILGFTDLLKNPKLNGETRQKYIEIIQQSGKRMIVIINDLIDISKIEAGQIDYKESEININELLDSLYNFFKLEAANKGLEIKVEKELSSENSFFKTDKSKLSQIISNLLKNAIKYTKQGFIKFGYKQVNNMLEFFVEDTGIGIKSDLREKIFERFRQADLTYIREYEGAGLGLSITKAYVELLGGKIWVDSELSKGSVFYFTIPYNYIKNNHITSKKVESMSHKKPVSENTILIAEDDDISFMYLQELLYDKKLNILHAANGKIAVEMVKSNPEINLVLMDVKMPVMNGFEATRLIKQIRPELPVIAQTAFASNNDKKESLDAGCDDYISKPINATDLMNKIVNLIR